jgi:hypothetical protein
VRAHVFSTEFERGGTISWGYAGRFCFRPSDPTAASLSQIKLWVTSERDVPLFFTAYFDDPFSQNFCDKSIDCYESSVAKDKWSNVYRGVPSHTNTTASCVWRLKVAEKRGALISLRKLVTENVAAAAAAAAVGRNLSAPPVTLTLPFLDDVDRAYYFGFAACEAGDLNLINRPAPPEYPLQGIKITVALTNSYHEPNMAYLSSDEYEEMVCCRWGAGLAALLTAWIAGCLYRRRHAGKKMHRLSGFVFAACAVIMLSFSARTAYYTRRGAPRPELKHALSAAGVLGFADVPSLSLDPEWWLDSPGDIAAGCCETLGRVATLLALMLCMKGWGMAGSGSQPKMTPLERVWIAGIVSAYATTETIYVLVVATDEGYSRSGAGEATAWTSARLGMRTTVVAWLLFDACGPRIQAQAPNIMFVRGAVDVALKTLLAGLGSVWVLVGATVGSRIASPFLVTAGNPCEEVVAARYAESVSILLIVATLTVAVFRDTPHTTSAHRSKRGCGMFSGGDGSAWVMQRPGLARQIADVRQEVDGAMALLESVVAGLAVDVDRGQAVGGDPNDRGRRDDRLAGEHPPLPSSRSDIGPGTAPAAGGVKVGEFGFQFTY